MGLLSGAMDFLGLTPDFSGAIEAAQFNPYNINTGYGTVRYNPDSRTFTAGLDHYENLFRNRMLSEATQMSGDKYLGLMRERAAPHNQALYESMENRLQKQGLLGASKEYDAGGRMRGMFDSFAQQDLGFQLSADQMAQQQRDSLFNKYMAMNQMEQGLFSPAIGFGQIGMSGQQAQSNLMAQEAMAMPNLMSSLLGGATMGWAMGGFSNPFSSGMTQQEQMLADQW